MRGKRVRVLVEFFLQFDISSMLAHSGFEMLLGITNIDLPSVLAFYFVDNEGVPANVVVFAVIVVVVVVCSAVARECFEVYGFNSF
jgi:uncharacterized membrane protein